MNSTTHACVGRCLASSVMTKCRAPNCDFPSFSLPSKASKKDKKHLLVIEDRIGQTGAASFSFFDELLGELEGLLLVLVRRLYDMLCQTSYRR